MGLLYQVIELYIDTLIEKKRAEKARIESTTKRLTITEQIAICHCLEDVNRLKLIKNELLKNFYYINEIENKE